MKKILNTICLIFLLFSVACGPSTSEMASDADGEQAVPPPPPPPPSVKQEKTGKTSETWKRAQEGINKFELFVGEGDKLPLKGSQMMVQVDGFRARVLIDCYFYNDKDWALEGTFKLRLPNEAVPYYFAFGETVFLDKDQSKIPVLDYDQKKDIELSADKIREIRMGSWSNPKEARVVPKEKAALAYSQTVNRAVDPALMEWSGAGIFDCRVYPLQPKKLHRIVLGYEVNLTSINNDKIIQIPLPDNKVPLIVDLDVANLGKTVEIIPSRDMEKLQDRQRMHIQNPDFKEISVRYKNIQNCLLVSPGNSNEKYFASDIKVQVNSQSNSKIPGSAVIMLDVSLSSKPEKFNVWLKMAEALLKNNQDVIKDFAVLYFNIENHWWQTKYVPNNSENIQKMLEYCNNMCLIGATDISSALKEAGQPRWSDKRPKSIFLLTDGNISWGETDIYLMMANIPKTDKLYCFNTGIPGTDLNALEQLTRESGGAIYSVSGEDEVNAASKAFRSLPWKILDVKLEGCSDLLIGGRPNYIYSGQELILTGRGDPSKKASISFKIEQNGLVKNLNIPFSQIIESDLTKNIYGQLATNQLEEFGFPTEEYAIAYATHYGIPGKTCSFVMLESDADYERYNIKPENELFIVKNNPVHGIIEKLMIEITSSLGNPKSIFSNWLKKLSKTPGLTFEIPVAFKNLLDEMDMEDFRILTSAFSCKKRFVSDYSPEIIEQVSHSELDYDTISIEAEKLKSVSIYDDLKVLSSLVEKNQGDGVLLRDVAYTAMDYKLYDQAYYLLKYVLEKRPYEPQTYHSIAQSLAKMGKNKLAVLYYEIALQTQWDPRFGEFTYIIALDYMSFIRKMGKDKVNTVFRDYLDSRLKELNHLYPNESNDLMITISWNTDFTDIDLHVKEPSGEECYYKHTKTEMGGMLTRDVTQGYGPEMYVLKDAKPGKYEIYAHCYASNRNRTSAPTKVYATIYQNWGKVSEKVTSKTVVLKENKESQEIMMLNLRD
jgi:hypothetical protein